MAYPMLGIQCKGIPEEENHLHRSFSCRIFLLTSSIYVSNNCSHICSPPMLAKDMPQGQSLTETIYDAALSIHHMSISSSIRLTSSCDQQCKDGYIQFLLLHSSMSLTIDRLSFRPILSRPRTKVARKATYGATIPECIACAAPLEATTDQRWILCGPT